MLIRSLTAAVLAAAVASLSASSSARAADDAPGLKETKEQKEARMAWCREARFGMFIHWGVYSVPAGTYKGVQVKHIGEWIQNDAKIPVAEYAKYAERFNPTEFDADAWVKLAKDAGQKYIVITSKHHDGFAMFHSKASPYNIYDATPFNRDPIAELAKACQKHGIKFGLYYSQAQDWHHPGGAAAKGHPDAAGITDFKPIDKENHWDPAQQGSMDEYIDKVAVPQVKEILTNYGPIAVLWWDTPVGMNRERADKLFEFVPQLQPNIITNNRLGGGYIGDTETPEQYIPPTGFPGRDFEVCMTMNDTWGWRDWDDHWKSTETILKNLIDIASKGGNYLLNVGPTDKGVIPQPSVDRLQEIGKWMKANGDSIYGTTASPFRKYAFDGRTTVKGNTLYVHVFKWGDNDSVTLAGLKNKAKSAAVLATGDAAKFDSSESGLTLHKPSATDPIATTIAVQLDGPPDVDNTAWAIKPGESGAFILRPSTAMLGGKSLKLAGEGSDQYIGSWTGRRDTVLWDLLVPTPGDYDVTVELSSDEKNAGSTYAVSSSHSTIQGKVTSTGGITNFETQPLGKLHLDKGVQPLMVRPVDVPNGLAVMNLKSIKLTPAK